jgi:hypothetical protein
MRNCRAAPLAALSAAEILGYVAFPLTLVGLVLAVIQLKSGKRTEEVTAETQKATKRIEAGVAGIADALKVEYERVSVEARDAGLDVTEAVGHIKVSYADINHDGDDEVIITAPFGAHGFKLTAGGARGGARREAPRARTRVCKQAIEARVEMPVDDGVG